MILSTHFLACVSQRASHDVVISIWTPLAPLGSEQRVRMRAVIISILIPSLFQHWDTREIPGRILNIVTGVE